MNMREQMARAMYEKMRTLVHGGAASKRTWANQSNALRDDWRATADAALDALMEPRDGMITEGRAWFLSSDEVEREYAKGCWVAMVSAIKEDK